MKLNSMKAQLREWEKAFKGSTTRGRATIEDIIGVDIRSKKERRRARMARPQAEEPQSSDPPLRAVVSGFVRRKPVNAQAQQVFQREPWYHHPPKKSENEKSNEVMKPKQRREHYSPPADPATGTGGHVKALNIDGTSYVPEDMIQELVEKRLKAIPPELGSCSSGATGARSAMKAASDDMAADVDKFNAVVRTHLQSIQSTSTVVTSEVHAMLTAFRDVRQFFLSKEHDKETARLEEFVELCERLRKLKESGFLDTMADTILRMESKATE